MPLSEIEGGPDVTIAKADAIPDLADATVRESWYQVSPSAFRLSVQGVADYLVTAGRKILVLPGPDADPAQVRLFLLGSAMGALLYQRGLFPLHGGAVETPWGAMIFVGPSGIGKSTLAAHFLRRGYRLLSDDVCAITKSPAGQLMVLPAFPQVRLCADAFARLNHSPGPSSSLRSQARFEVDKFILPLGADYCPVAVPLGAVHVLRDQEDPEPSSKPLRGFDRIQQLAENLYRPHYLRGMQARGEVLRLAGEIASSVDVVQLSRRREAADLDELALWLEDGWKGRAGLAAPPEA